MLSDNQRRRVRRAARDRGAFTDAELFPLTWQDLATLNGWACYICGNACNPDDFVQIVGAPFKNLGPTYPTLDHVEPIADGGAHEPANARLACLRCNTTKGRLPLDACVRRRLRLGRPVNAGLLAELGLEPQEAV